VIRNVISEESEEDYS